MNLSDFRATKSWYYESDFTLWGTKTTFGVVLNEAAENKENALAEYLPVIEKKLGWLEQNKAAIEKALLDDGIIALAENWAAGAEEAEDEGGRECYIMEDGQKVWFPITSTDFSASLSTAGFTFYCEEGRENVVIDLFLVCSPDYFAGHSINMTIKADGSIRNSGLFG